jgi:hypothetical protein
MALSVYYSAAKQAEVKPVELHVFEVFQKTPEIVDQALNLSTTAAGEDFLRNLETPP